MFAEFTLFRLVLPTGLPNARVTISFPLGVARTVGRDDTDIERTLVLLNGELLYLLQSEALNLDPTILIFERLYFLKVVVEVAVLIL